MDATSCLIWIPNMTIWKNLQFTRFFASFTIGNIGDWFDVFALQIIFVHEFHATPVLMGLLWLFFFLPSIILGPIAGVWADRMSKRNLMLCTDAMAAILTIGLYFSSGVIEALALLFIRSCLTTVNAPAQQVYIKHVVTDDQLLQASSITTIVFKMCQVIGPMLGAVVLIYTSARACLLINAGSFVISALILMTLVKDKVSAADLTETLHWSKDMLTGTKIIWGNRLLRIMVTLLTVWFFCSLVRQAQLVIYLKHVLPSNKHALGFFMGLDGLGAVISGALLSRKKDITNCALYFFLGFLLLGAGIFGLSIYHVTWPHAILYTFAITIGLGTGINLVVYGYILKKETSKSQMGRVSSAASTLGSIALAIGTLSSGFLVMQFGIKEMYFGLSVIMAILSICSIIFITIFQKAKASQHA